MDLKEVDARGLACPQPVILAKKALEGIKEGRVEVLVDNPVARDNVIKLARSMGCPAEAEEGEGEEYTIFISRGERVGGPAPGPGTLLLIPTDTLGQGPEELGTVLIKGFLHTLAETDQRPTGIILINAGVKLAVRGAETLPALATLEEAGVEILACGTCLDYFGLKEELAVGAVSNMYTIAEEILSAEKVATIP